MKGKYSSIIRHEPIYTPFAFLDSLQELDEVDPCDDIIHFSTRKLRQIRILKVEFAASSVTMQQFIRHAKKKLETYENNQKIELERRRMIKAQQAKITTARPEEPSDGKRSKKSTALVRGHSVYFLF